MREVMITLCLAALLLVVVLPTSSGQSGVPDECALTAQMDVYSDARVSTETGDLIGFDLALDKPNGHSRNARLFVYEGGESKGIPLIATAEGNNLVVEGTWVEHLVEYPSKKETVQTHQVKIIGKLTPKSIRGKISIEDLGIVNPENMRLRRVKRIWVCNTISPGNLR